MAGDEDIPSRNESGAAGEQQHFNPLFERVCSRNGSRSRSCTFIGVTLINQSRRALYDLPDYKLL